MASSPRIALALHIAAFILFVGLATGSLTIGTGSVEIVVVSVILGALNLWRIVTLMEASRKT